MKNQRQETILRAIRENPIGTQEELVNLLKEQGFKATQSTVSRDIRTLRLVKTSDDNGQLRYVAPGKEEMPVDERLIRIFRDAILSVETACNQVVVKTLSGSAGTAAEMIDRLQWSEILGSIAGDNTILLIARSDEDAIFVAESLRTMLE